MAIGIIEYVNVFFSPFEVYKKSHTYVADEAI